MTATSYFTGDTIRVKVTFRDWAVSPAVGAVVDPDEVSVTTYSGEDIIYTVPNGDPKITRISVGLYQYDWVLPDENGKYIIEFKGTYNDITGAEPCIVRTIVNVKFKPS